MAEKGVEFAGALFWFWTKLGQFEEGRRWLERALAVAVDASASLQHVDVDNVEGVKFYSDEDPTGSQAREVELERSGT